MNPRTTKRIARIIAIITIVALVVTSATFLGSMYWGASYGASPSAEDEAYLNGRIEMLKEYIKTVESQYKDDVDYETLINGAYGGVVDILGDPYSSYYADQGDSDDFVTDVLGVFSGVGLSLEEYDGHIRVVAAMPETPAGKAGVLTGDIIKSIDGVSVSGKSMNDIISLIRGEEGSRVDIVFDRAGTDIPCSLVRETIRIASVGGELLEDGIGYIRIASFDDDSDEEFGRIKKELIDAGATSLILDVRNNPGGLIGTVVSLAEQIMPDSPIIYFRQKGNLTGVQRASGKNYTEMPMVLLINGGSASSSEILAGALKDSGVAVLVGTETYGKGVGQAIFDIPGNGSLKLSTFYFETPDKNKVDKVGVSPDYYVPIPTAFASADELLKQYASFAPMSENTKPALGATGLNVFGAQQRLAFLGYDVSVTGTVDEATETAVKRFQSTAGLYAYGVLDYGTMARIDEECVKYAAGADVQGEDPQLAKAIELLRKR
ncbi:MAG: S41 family peptidase [Clostridiales Family XIII bacterium]|jgi:carboxyl-terminal processing protease|nr:S41 family peptidase [Clostridiales Family XIII bacterium]